MECARVRVHTYVQAMLIGYKQSDWLARNKTAALTQYKTSAHGSRHISYTRTRYPQLSEENPAVSVSLVTYDVRAWYMYGM